MSVPHTFLPDIETASDRYASRFAGPVGEFFLEVQREAVQTFLPARGEGLTVLEVGGGHGQVTGLLGSLGYQVTVHGSRPVALERVKRSNARLVVSSLTSLPFADRSFDIVVALRVLPHVDDSVGFINELCRVARRRVIFDYAELLSMNVLTPVLFSIKKAIEKNTRPYFCHRLRWLKNAVRENGFSYSGRVPQFAVPMGLHRAVKKASLSETAERMLGRLGVRRAIGTPVIFCAERTSSSADLCDSREMLPNASNGTPGHAVRNDGSKPFPGAPSSRAAKGDREGPYGSLLRVEGPLQDNLPSQPAVVILSGDSNASGLLGSELTGVVGRRYRSFVATGAYPALNENAYMYSARALDEQLARLSVNRAVLLGYGSGALLALTLAAQSPTRIRRLLLVNPVTSMSPSLTLRVIGAIEQFLPCGLPFRSSPNSFEFGPHLHRVRCPSLVVDTGQGSAASEALAARIPNAEYAVLPGDPKAPGVALEAIVNAIGRVAEIPIKCPARRAS